MPWELWVWRYEVVNAGTENQLCFLCHFLYIWQLLQDLVSVQLQYRNAYCVRKLVVWTRKFIFSFCSAALGIRYDIWKLLLLVTNVMLYDIWCLCRYASTDSYIAEVMLATFGPESLPKFIRCLIWFILYYQYEFEHGFEHGFKQAQLKQFFVFAQQSLYGSPLLRKDLISLFQP